MHMKAIYYFPSVYVFEFNLEKGKPCRITACMRKIAASALLKLFNNCDERCHILLAHEWDTVFKCKQIQSMIHEDPKHVTTQ